MPPAEAVEEAPKAAPKRSTLPRRLAIRAAVAVAVALAMLGFLSLAGAGAEAATYGMVLATLALLYCLNLLYRMVAALARPNVQTVLDREGAVASASRRELREERRRVLRAIKELDFDFEMGKISKDDYDPIRDGYRLRAIEVMRQLDDDPDLHPELAKELARRQGQADEPPAPAGDGADAEESDDEQRDLACSSCGKANDGDAKFCKHCGSELEK